MKNTSKGLMIAAVLSGIGFVNLVDAAQARPHDDRRTRSSWNKRDDRRNGWRNDRRNDWRNDRRRGNNSSDRREFTGRAVADNRSGNLMQVRADNGTTYTVRSTANVRRGQRLRVSGYLRNGIIENARVSRY